MNVNSHLWRADEGMIGRKVASGGAMLVGARLLTRLVDLATLLVLARILHPADFGLVAIAMSLLMILETALELPINQALVRLPSITCAQYDTAFTLSILRGAVLSGILLIVAWPFARFYHDDRLLPLVFVLSLSSVARGITSPRLAEFQKSMSFWRDLVMEVGGKLAGFTVSLATALLTGSYWSLAAGTVASPLATLALSYIVAPYRPRLSLSELAVFRGFVGWSSAAQMVSAVNWQCERLLLGKVMPTARLGLFSTASDIAGIPFLALIGPLYRPLLAAFALQSADRARLAKSYQSASAGVLAIGLPLLVGQCLVAYPAIRFILGAQWQGAAPILQWLALATIPALLAMPALPLVMSLNETKVLLHRNTLEFCVKFPIAMIGGIVFGFYGIAVARFVSELVAAAFCMRIVRDRLGVSIWQQIWCSWRSVASTLVMVLPVLACVHQLRFMADAGGAAVTVMVAGGVGMATYLVTLGVLWRLDGCPAGLEAIVVDMVRRALGSRVASKNEELLF